MVVETLMSWVRSRLCSVVVSLCGEIEVLEKEFAREVEVLVVLGVEVD